MAVIELTLKKGDILALTLEGDNCVELHGKQAYLHHREGFECIIKGDDGCGYNEIITNDDDNPENGL